jgi:hypothetical protein
MMTIHYVTPRLLVRKSTVWAQFWQLLELASLHESLRCRKSFPLLRYACPKLQNVSKQILRSKNRSEWWLIGPDIFDFQPGVTGCVDRPHLSWWH